MGFNIGKIVSTASTIANAASLASTIGNIDISGLTGGNIGSIKSGIESALTGQTSNITNQLESAISPGDIESMMGQFDIESKANELTSQIQTQAGSQSFDQSSIDAEVNKMMEEMNSKMSANMDFSSISFM